MIAALCGLLGFLVGLGVGVLVKDRLPSLPTWRPRITRRVELRMVLIGLVCLSLAGNFATGVLQIHNGKQTQRQAECNARYNDLDGKARDERADASKPQLDSEIQLWTTLRTQVAGDALTQASLLRAIDEHVAALQKVQSARLENPYPPSDYCLRGSPPPPNPPTPPTRSPSSTPSPSPSVSLGPAPRTP